MYPLDPLCGARDPSKMRRRQVLSEDVFEWPEFQALAKRLGVDLTKETTVLTLQMAASRPIVVDHQYEAGDTLGATVQPPMKQYNDKKGGQVLRCPHYDPKAVMGTGQCVLDAEHSGDCCFKA